MKVLYKIKGVFFPIADIIGESLTFHNGFVSWRRWSDDSGFGFRLVIRLRFCRLAEGPGLVSRTDVEQILQLTVVVFLVEQLGQSCAGLATQRRHVV